MSLFAEALVALLIVIGASFALVGSWGLIRMPDLPSRLHAPTKATTLGVGGALVASMVYFLAQEGALSIHEMLISLFLFLTAPITAHFIAKAWLHQHGDRARLPPAPHGSGWATFARARREAGPGDKPPAERAHGG